MLICNLSIQNLAHFQLLIGVFFFHFQLDAKNSPLALLAQTCNNIGKDANNKSLIPPFEKDKKKDSDKSGGDRSGSATSHSGSSNTTASIKDKTSSALDKSGIGLRSPTAKDNGSHHHSHKLISDLSVKRSPPPAHHGLLSSLKYRDEENNVMPPSSHSPLKDSRDSKSGDGGVKSGGSSTSSEKNTSTTSSSTTSTHLTSSHTTNGLHKSDSTSSLYPPTHLSSLAGYPSSLNGYPFTSGLLSASTTAAILAAHKHNPESVRYTTVRTASGATTLLPLCNDPYCTYCKVTLQSAQLASSPGSSPTCAAGCVQCTHDKAIGLPPSYPSTSLSSGLLGLHSLHGLSYPGSVAAAAAAAAASGHSSTSASPYVCSWIGTSGFCGKRFTSADELVQHLRSHTSSLDIPSLPSGLPLTGLGAAAAAAGLSHLYPGSGLGSVSPSSLRQAYPRSLSPTSVLAASRFHPYLKASLSGLGTTGLDAGALPAVHPSLGAYSSLYSLYGHKLGVP